MSVKDEALRLIGELPDGCTWMDVLHACAAGAGGTLVAVTDAPGEMATSGGSLEMVAEHDLDGWCIGSVPIPHGGLSHAPPLAEVMGRVREAVEACLTSAGFQPAPFHPDARKMN